MISKKRILYISHEISPYLELTEFAELVNRLIVKSNNSGFEVRCIMPRFASINERRHKLHEVLRLTGISIHLGPEEFPLQIKVASLGNARVQVYFLENEDLFTRDDNFYDENQIWQKDNGLRALFFCKGIIETAKKFAWPPDIVHCSGWMASFLPLLIKRTYNKEPIFINTQTIYTACNNFFNEQLEPNTLLILQKEFGINKKDLEHFKDLNNISLTKAGMHFADSIMFDTNLDKSIYTNPAKNKKVYQHKNNEDLNNVIDFFNLVSK